MAYLIHPQGDNYSRDYFDMRCRWFDVIDREVLLKKRYFDYLYPYPVVVEDSETDRLIEVQAVLFRALEALISHYFADRDIAQYMPVSERVHGLLHSIDRRYRPDFLRPDFLYTDDSDPVICEINGRFILNGYFISHFGNRVVSSLLEVDPISSLDPLADCFSFLRDSGVAVLKDRESGFDIHTLMHISQEAELFDVDHCGDALCDTARLVLLELHQDELEPVLEKVVDFMNRGGEVVNDPRTVFLGHDKGMLAALCDRDLMLKYLSVDDVDLLSRYIIPTRCVSVRTLLDLIIDKKKYVLKERISGKTAGVYLGMHTSLWKWLRILCTKSVVIQDYVVQEEFQFWDPYTHRAHTKYLAGTLPMWGDNFYGPGIFRMFDSKNVFHGLIQPCKKK